MNDTLKTKISLLPSSPGCYLMKEKGEIIYVGKAVNLKNRVRSYFEKTDHTPKVQAMVNRVDDFDIVLARTELEALLLECNLIKRHMPFYNIRLKDDKGYPYIRVSVQENYPKITLARRVEKDGAKYFGPYIGASIVREVIDMIKKLFPLRTCKHNLPLKTPLRPCMNYEIGRCLAPCANACTKEEYMLQVKHAMRFLEGDYQEVLTALEDEMKQNALALKFERAGQIRDKIKDLQSIMQKQMADQKNTVNQDIIALSMDGLDSMATVIFIRNGKMIGTDQYPITGSGMEEEDEVLTDFLLLYYDERKPAREVIISSVLNKESMEKYLAQKREGACTLTVPIKGEKKALVVLAQKNAQDALQKRNLSQKIHHERTIGACEELKRQLLLKKTPRRIEGFDISNTQGDLNVASMVVFIDGEAQPKEYRHYRIKTFEGANDFASMNEVLDRRFERCITEDKEKRWVLPDLILIDGGKEQLKFARDGMLKKGIDVPMFGLAKKMEEIFLPDREDPILLDRKSPALHLIQRIRDEAHRFAVTHHTGLRGKKTVHSTLNDIEGIGDVRRRALLQHFKSIKAIKEAEVEDILKVKGMTKPSAQKVYDFFRKS